MQQHRGEVEPGGQVEADLHGQAAVVGKVDGNEQNGSHTRQACREGNEFAVGFGLYDAQGACQVGDGDAHANARLGPGVALPDRTQLARHAFSLEAHLQFDGTAVGVDGECDRGVVAHVLQ